MVVSSRLRLRRSLYRERNHATAGVIRAGYFIKSVTMKPMRYRDDRVVKEPGE